MRVRMLMTLVASAQAVTTQEANVLANTVQFAAAAICEDVPGYTYHEKVNKEFGGGNLQSLTSNVLAGSVCLSTCNSNTNCMGFTRFSSPTGSYCNLFGYLPTPVKCTTTTWANVYIKNTVTLDASCGPAKTCAAAAPPSAPTVYRDCDAVGHTCVDGDWKNSFGHTCADLRKYSNGGGADWLDIHGEPAGKWCCQFCQRDCTLATGCHDGYWKDATGSTCQDLRTKSNGGAPDWTDMQGKKAADECCQFCGTAEASPSPEATPTPEPGVNPSPEPTKPTCGGDPSTFDAGFGACSTYCPPGGNMAYCSGDIGKSGPNTGKSAASVCQECGTCSPAPVASPAPVPKPDNKIKGVLCPAKDILVVHSDCISGAPHFDKEGMVCADDGKPTEAYCSYGVGASACARCLSAPAPPPAPMHPFPPAPAPAGMLENGIYTLTGGRQKKLCCDLGTGRVVCNRGAVGPWEKFQLTYLGFNFYTLTGGKDKKMCADEGPTRMICNRGALGPLEKFELKHLGGNDYAMKGGHAKKWCADEAGGVICNRAYSNGAWEKFTFTKLSNGTMPDTTAGTDTNGPVLSAPADKADDDEQNGQDDDEKKH